jgi:hypothetical protein
MAFHNVLTAVGTSLGAMLGGLLAVAIPTRFEFAGGHFGWFTALYGVFLASSLGRIAVAVTFLPRLREVREVRAAPIGDFAWRLVRGAAVMTRQRLVVSALTLKKWVGMLIPERV